MGLEWIDIFMNNFLGFLTGITGLLAFLLKGESIRKAK